MFPINDRNKTARDTWANLIPNPYQTDRRWRSLHAARGMYLHSNQILDLKNNWMLFTILKERVHIIFSISKELEYSKLQKF